ncbi:MAG TPA: amidohydrolase family protein, partial [Verrucomicrobiae bacterium]|nr:amidohydrolase family protein [Verrucomicrobiae bacterium]
MGVVIRGGTIVNAGERFEADVKVEGRTITGIGSDLRMSTGDTTIDAQGRYVLPGFIDPHVHMELPFMGTVSIDDFETGTASGIAGGTTSIIDFCIPAPGTSLIDGLATWKQRAAKATADYSFHMAITSWGENTANEMRAVVRDHGITSFKVFMAYKGAIMVDDHALYQVMKTAA